MATGDIVIEGKNVEVSPKGISYGASYFPNYNETDQGAVGDGRSTKDYIDTISTDSATLVFQHNSGAATTTYTFSTSETIPSNINVIIEKGAILSTAAAQTLTINNFSDPGLYQVFSGDGNVVLEDKVIRFPIWWGADITGTNDNSSIFTSMVSSVTTKGIISLGVENVYRLNTAVAAGNKDIEIAGPGGIKLGAEVYAFSVDGGVIRINDVDFTTATSATGTIATALSESTGYFRRNTSIALHGGIHNYWNNSIFEDNNLSVLPASNAGLYVIHLAGSDNIIKNNQISGGRHGIYISGGPPTPTDPVENNLVQGNILTGIGYGAIAVYATPTQGAVKENKVLNNIIIDTVSGNPIDLNTNTYNNDIRGNTINGYVAGHGISIEGQALTTAGRRPYNNTISNNVIICKVVNETTYRGIKILNGYNNTLIGNTFIHPVTTTVSGVYGVHIDSQNTPADYYNRVINNSFTLCEFGNSSAVKTEVIGNTFYPATAQIPIVISAFGTASVGLNNLGSEGASVTLAVNDTTPTVKNGYLFTATNTNPTNITDFDNGYLGQKVTVMFTNGQTTLIDVTGAGHFRLLGATSFTYLTYTVSTFVKKSATEWWEVSRSVN